ncbi:hypothetical protein C0995_004601, partial [Termitomyces sp. Mi166
MPISKPPPVKSAGKPGKPAVKGGSVFKDSFMVRQFKLAGTEESSAPIINQVTEVAAGKVTSVVAQETLNDDEDDNEGSKGNDDNSNNDDNAVMDIDSGNLDVKILKVLCSEETQPLVPTKLLVTEVVAPVPVP